MTPQQVTEEEVREALPNGVIHIGEEGADPIQTVFRTVMGEPLMTGWHKVVKPISDADLHYTTRCLSPDQIAVAINERCGTCGGDGYVFEWGLRGARDESPCPDCRDSSGNPTGSAAPELLELVRGRSEP